MFKEGIFTFFYQWIIKKVFCLEMNFQIEFLELLHNLSPPLLPLNPNIKRDEVSGCVINVCLFATQTKEKLQLEDHIWYS